MNALTIDDELLNATDPKHRFENVIHGGIGNIRIFAPESSKNILSGWVAFVSIQKPEYRYSLGGDFVACSLETGGHEIYVIFHNNNI